VLRHTARDFEISGVWTRRLICPETHGKTWQYFAQAVIQEEDPEKLTYLMQELYRVLKDDGKQPTRTF
jgi:hypothetical protein